RGTRRWGALAGGRSTGAFGLFGSCGPRPVASPAGSRRKEGAGIRRLGLPDGDPEAPVVGWSGTGRTGGSGDGVAERPRRPRLGWWRAARLGTSGAGCSPEPGGGSAEWS
ncbi:MAG TPA: hypothetical protein VK942_17885, partial [Actinomycetes bacterium]|nr:hypothetical protein [Actinomycetes bacterium]